MKKFKQYLSEASLGRIFQIVNDKKNSFAILTAFRGTNDLQTNRKLNNQLKNDIRDNGFGFIKIIGSFIEDKGKETEKKVTEESFFINGGQQGSKLKGFVRKAIKKYNQESAIFRDSNTEDGSAVFIEKSGKEIKAGKLTVGKIGDFMSKIAKANKHATFVFEEINVPLGWIELLKLSKLIKKEE